MALITRQSPCADLVTSVRISPPARPDVSTIPIVFYLLVPVLTLGSKVNIPYDYDSPVAALSAELVQALFTYYCILYIVYNYPCLLARVLF